MLKRLIVLTAALAMVFVFASTSSAQDTGNALPADCTDIDDAATLQACLDELGKEGGLAVPEECDALLGADGNLLDPSLNLTDATGNLLACLTAIAELVPAGEEPDDAPYDAGYGYDYGYDVGYDEAIPEGGVASGFGPKGSDAAGAPLAARGAALLALVGVLATGLLIMRRRHGS